MTRNDDSSKIADMLTARIEQVLDSLNPGYVTHKGKAYLTAKSAKELGSFQVNLVGQHRGTFYRFSQQIGGGPVKLVAYLLAGASGEPTKDDFKRAFQWARDSLGLDNGRAETESERRSRDNRLEDQRKRREAEAAQERQKSEARAIKRQHTALEIFTEATALAGTHAEAYLVERGIPPVSDWPWKPDDVLRFHPALDYWDGDRTIGRFPALVCAVMDAFGDLTAVWRIYLDPGRPVKADVPNPKVGLGPSTGGAIRIGGTGPRIGLCEGVETALGDWHLTGCRYPVWSGMSTAIASFDPPMGLERIDVFPDGDRAIMSPNGAVQLPPGYRAALRLKERMAPIGIKTVINEAPMDGDGLDMWNGWRSHA